MSVFDVQSVIRQFNTYKELGEKAMERMTDAQINEQPGPSCNAVSVIVRHLHGNMMSRCTDFLESDGEKSWRMRDEEFESDCANRELLMRRWNEGWDCLFDALGQLQDSDLERTVRIRGEQHSVTEAIHRQMMHYAYHVGQLVYVSKWMNGAEWESLSIPKGGSESYNREMLRKEPLKNKIKPGDQ